MFRSALYNRVYLPLAGRSLNSSNNMESTCK